LRVRPHTLYCGPMSNHKLLSLLIALLLTLSPFAALDVAAALAGKGHCMTMGSSDNGDAVGMHHATTSPGDQGMPNCKYCQDNSCSDNNCADHGCGSGHGLSVLNTPVTPVHYGGTASHGVSACAGGLLSRSAPPLLRPPV